MSARVRAPATNFHDDVTAPFIDAGIDGGNDIGMVSIPAALTSLKNSLRRRRSPRSVSVSGCSEILTATSHSANGSRAPDPAHASGANLFDQLVLANRSVAHCSAHLRHYAPSAGSSSGDLRIEVLTRPDKRPLSARRGIMPVNFKAH
jgi:hypothetical protein